MNTAPDIEASLKAFGMAVRVARGKRRWRQSEVAERIGASVSTVRKVEAGFHGTAFGTVIALSQLLQVPLGLRDLAASPAQLSRLQEAAPRRVRLKSLDPALDV